MTEESLQSALQNAVAAIAAMGRLGARFLLLSVALLCYGAVPSTPTIQTEYEAQLQEEIASSDSHLDLRNKLRGAAQRRAGVVSAAIGSAAQKSAARSAQAELSSPQLSLGLVTPLRL